MKKAVFFLVAVAVTVICNSQIVQKNEKGGYRVVEQGDLMWENTDIKMEGNAHLFVDSFSLAITHPGQPVVLWQKTRVIKFKPVFKKLLIVEGMALIYDDSKGILSLVDLEANPREENSYLIIFFLALIFMMLLSNIFINKDLYFLGDVFSLTTALLIVIWIIIFADFFDSTWNNGIRYNIIFAVLSFIAAFMVFVVSDDKKVYKAVSIIFYILILTFIIFLFI